jgi:hypothetical protein
MSKFEPVSLVNLSKPEQLQGRRKFPRRNFDNKVGVLCAGKYNVYGGLIIGEGGLSIRSASMFESESAVLLTFRIPGGSIILIRANVKNQFKLKTDKNMNDVGMQFINLQFSDKRLIRTFVAARGESELINLD